MTGRADATLAALVALAGLAAAAVASSLLALGGGGATDLAEMVAGWFSACIMFFLEARHIPAAVLLIVLLVSASTVSLLATVLGAIVEQRSLARLVRPARGERLFGVPVLVLASRRPAAFCSGLIRPRVYVTEALLRSLERDELEAAVRHEAAHAAAYVPLKSLVARLLARTFFWLPTLGDLEARFTLTAELAADDAAIRATSSRAVAAALARVLDSSSPATGFASLADARIEKLLDPSVTIPPLLSRARLALTGVALVVVVALAVSPPHLGAAEREHLHVLAGSALLHRLLWQRFAIVAGVAAVASVALVSRRRRRA